MPNTRILYTAFDVVPSPKGASTHILHFIRGLTSAGYTVNLVTPGDGILPERDELEGAQVWRVPLPGELHFLARAQAFSEAVVKHLEQAPPYQIVHYRSIWGGLGLAQERRIRGYHTLFEVNGLPSIELKYHYPELASSPLLLKIREQEQATLALSDAVICPSAVTRLFLESLGTPRGKVTVIPNGVNPDEFRQAAPRPRGNTPPTLLYIGTLADWQGLEELIHALPLLLVHGPLRLRIVGRGRSRQRKALLKHARKLGLEAYVEIEPAVPHHAVPELIASADVCIAPLSVNDRNVTQGCCPIKVLEYMACGRPLVASNLPVVRELVREGQDGLLAAPGDPADLAYQVHRLLEDPALAQRLGESAAQRARARFTWRAAQKRLLRVYAGLLGEEREGG